MNEKLAEAIIGLLEKGGAEAGGLATLYVWLNSTLMIGVAWSMVLVVFAVGIVFIMYAGKRLDF